MKRAVATIEVYVYGETDAELIEAAKEIVKRENDLNDSRASLTVLVEQPFGTIGNRVITINK